jgi:hypothetical protein
VNKTGVISVIVILHLQFGQVSLLGTMGGVGLVLMTFPFIQRISGEQSSPLAWVPSV